jgi:hypothetical protein
MPFCRTGHLSSQVIFGAAAIGSMRQERADELSRCCSRPA